MINVYSKPNCRFCDQAKALLQIHNLEYNELCVGVDITREQLIELMPLAKSVPQIEVDGIYIGGYKELVRYLDEQSA